MRLQLNDSSGDWEQGHVLPGRREATLRAALVTLVGEDYAMRVLRRIGPEGIEHMTEQQIAASSGIPYEYAERVVAARTLTTQVRGRSQPHGSTPKRLFAALPESFGRLEHEVLLGLALTGAFRVKAVVVLSMGGISGAALFPRDVFVPILRHGASAFAVAHNHPSGDALPSREDIVLTNRLSRCGALMGAPLVDHLVVVHDGFTSFSEAGLLLSDAEIQESLSSNTFGSLGTPSHGDEATF